MGAPGSAESLSAGMRPHNWKVLGNGARAIRLLSAPRVSLANAVPE